MVGNRDLLDPGAIYRFNSSNMVGELIGKLSLDLS